MLTALTLLPLLATGQLGTVAVTVGDGAQNVNISSTNCPDTISAAWTATFSGFPCTEGLTFWVTSTGTCGSTIGAGDLALQSVSQASLSATRTGIVSIPVPGLFELDSDAGATCATKGISITDQVCAAFTVDTTSTCITKQTITGTPIPTITFDSVPPDPPSLGAVDAFDGTITMPVTIVSTDTSTYRLWTATGEDDGGMSDFKEADGNPRAATVTTGKLTGLTNGVTYYIFATATDIAGNDSSTHSNIVTGTPQATTGFWGAYREDGGVAQGCSSAPGVVAFSALALIGVAMLRRRRS